VWVPFQLEKIRELRKKEGHLKKINKEKQNKRVGEGEGHISIHKWQRLSTSWIGNSKWADSHG
jgi:hypothetical protein